MENNKLLIVDDIPSNLQLLFLALKDEYEVHSTTSSFEALKLVEVLVPDLIILDIMMPEMDGLALCRRLKDMERLREVPVIFVTAMAEDINEMEGFKAGAVDYITKPFKPALVKQRIATHLALKQQRDMLVKATQELRRALDEVKILSGLLPICMSCKKIRDDRGYWTQVEDFISRRTDARFTHGCCPECAVRLSEAFRKEIHILS